MCTNETVTRELMALAQRNILMPGVRQARWLLRGMVQPPEAPPPAWETEGFRPEPSPRLVSADERRRQVHRASSALHALRHFENVTPGRYRAIMADGKEAIAVHILGRQNRLHLWMAYKEDEELEDATA